MSHPEGYPREKAESGVDVERETVDVSGVFYAVGHTPNTQFRDNTGVERDERGYTLTKTDDAGRPTTQTTVDDVFVAGAVAHPRYRQAITSAGTGDMAALDAEELFETLQNTGEPAAPATATCHPPPPEAGGIPTAFGISGFVVHDLFSWGENALTTAEQANRWLCQPAGIPIAVTRGETREYLLPSVFRAVHVRVRNRVARLAHVLSTFYTLIVAGVAARRTQLRRITFGRQLHVDALGFRLVVEERGEAAERPPVRIHAAVVAPIPRFTALVVEPHRGRPRQAYQHLVRPTPLHLESASPCSVRGLWVPRHRGSHPFRPTASVPSSD
jgi:antitoxin (DNA-binding transcriptional repressor) of toxin-antitoxin stability system